MDQQIKLKKISDSHTQRKNAVGRLRCVVCIKKS